MNILRPQIIDPRWESTLPGPPGRNNGGAADIAASGLLAYASGSSVSVVDTRSMQLVTVIPVPPPAFSTPPSSTSSSSSSSTVSPFVTSVRWAPHSLLRHIDVLSTTDVHSLSSHLVLAAGDRHGRLFLLDLRARSPLLFFDTDDSLKLGIQDICWVQSHVDTWILAAVNGPHVFSLYSTSTGKCFFKYDAKREFISCIRRDPFDSRHFCALGLKGLLFSVKVMGDSSEDDVVLKELQIRIDSTELEKLERDLAGGSSNSPASAIFPTYPAKCSFSIEWRHILFVSFPRELVVFDLQYETTLFGASMPRGGKFLDIFPDPSRELLYCVHLDGKLSTWKRRG